MIKPRLIAITIIRNEEKNFLDEWLDNIGHIADYHIFLDDASDDNTPQRIREHLRTFPGELHQRSTSIFRENEPALRSELWEYARAQARPGDWILIVDADEFYDGHMLRLKQKLLGNECKNIEVVKVSCLDLWNASGYRTDGHWSPRKSDVRVIKYHNVPFGAYGTALHMPPYPASTDVAKNYSVYVPKIHFAYLRKSDRVRRYEFYRKNVLASENSISYKHALSINDKKVSVKKYFTFLRTIFAALNSDALYFKIKKAAKKYEEI